MKSFTHENLLLKIRGKNHRYFLEPVDGVGATGSRGYMTRKPILPRDCFLCGSQEYVCLGTSCLGSGRKPGRRLGGPKHLSFFKPIEIPGQVYKKFSCYDTEARNPRLKGSQTSVNQTPKNFKYSLKKRLKSMTRSCKKKKLKVVYDNAMNVFDINCFQQRRRRNCGVETVLIDNTAQIQLKAEEWRKILFRKRKLKQEDSPRIKSENGKKEGNERKYEKRSIDSKPDISCEVPCGYEITKKTDTYRMITRKLMIKSIEKTFKLHKPDSPSFNYQLQRVPVIHEVKCLGFQVLTNAIWVQVELNLVARSTLGMKEGESEDREMNTAELFILLEELLSVPPAADSGDNCISEEETEVLERRMDQEAEKEGQLTKVTYEVFDDPPRR